MKNNRDEFILFRFLVISGIEFLGAFYLYIIQNCIKDRTAASEPSERKMVSCDNHR